LCITSSNLDEFFEVRVAGLKQQAESDLVERGPDGWTARETLPAIRKRVLRMIEQQYRCWHDELVPNLERNGIRFLSMERLQKEDLEGLGEVFWNAVASLLAARA